MYTLYYSPGSVSMVTHMVLEELGVPFEAVKVNLEKKAHHEPAYLKINPKAKVPSLGTSDGVITESVAILEYLLDKHGDGSLLAQPATVERARTMERMAYLATEIHPLMNRYFHADDYAAEESVQKAVSEFGQAKIVAFFQREDGKLTAPYWSGGTAPNVADFYFAVVARWGRWFKPKSIEMPNIRAFQERMASRPSVQRATAREGNTLFS
ncbi:Glutathione S-transferase GST-6.0 [Usitatibacter rugosus]|uniref:Glutathione S-transferase GST-6.0 n=1 Tax=Usitatibacter rugosus TaxID=2732067 RepID=A0A6M4GTV3_9PROT|nr:glutathione S-transferase family protein [Usitatibacter rugosus]QJR09753.1 Glutathione S-transferase GST-6.0 [Usitatibacter rugosus]